MMETTVGHSLIVLKEVVTQIRDNCSDYCWINIALPAGTQEATNHKSTLTPTIAIFPNA